MLQHFCKVPWSWKVTPLVSSEHSNSSCSRQLEGLAAGREQQEGSKTTRMAEERKLPRHRAQLGPSGLGWSPAPALPCAALGSLDTVPWLQDKGWAHGIVEKTLKMSLQCKREILREPESFVLKKHQLLCVPLAVPQGLQSLQDGNVPHKAGALGCSAPLQSPCPSVLQLLLPGKP